MKPCVDYPRWRYAMNQHHARYVRYVTAHGLPCQACSGRGGERYVILDDGTGPWEPCGWCEGTGMVTRRTRGAWLRWMAVERKERLARNARRAA